MSKHLRPRHSLGSLALTLVFILWCASVILALAQSAQPENKQSDSLRGVVVNSVTREPVGRALIYSNDNRYATMTDGEGRFEFTFPPDKIHENTESASESTNTPGAMGENVNCGGGGCVPISPPYRGQSRPQMLIARKPGFLDERNGTLNGAPNPEAAVAGKELTIELTPEALIVGRVVLPTSEPSDTIQLGDLPPAGPEWSRALGARRWSIDKVKR